MVYSRTFRSENTAERHLFPWVGALLLILAGCGSGSDDRPPVQEKPAAAVAEAVATEVGTPLEAVVTQAIGPAGGVIESADGALRVEVPAGAFAAEQIVSIQPISNHAHGKIGGAYRLGPEGTPFASPVRLTFYFTPEQILGTTPQLLRVASQNIKGFWELHEKAKVDADEATVSVETNHFSDWSLVTGAQLSPQFATVKPGETVSLSVVVCELAESEDLLAPFATCQPSEVIRSLVKNWSVNGVPGGDGNVGTVAVQDDRSALYTAPATAPQPNSVAVSTEYTTLGGALEVLVSNIRVESGLCTPASLGEPCYFDLVEFNGQPLPYENLPRKDYQNPEIVTAGRLSLRDSDGDGAGTWSMRPTWVEERRAGDLEQFVQFAGDFTSDSTGKLRFTVLGGQPFTGAIEKETVTIEGYPFSTKNATVSAKLKFQQKK